MAAIICSHKICKAVDGLVVKDIVIRNSNNRIKTCLVKMALECHT